MTDVAVEASEQCRRLTVPSVAEPEKLDAALARWDPARPLYVCDERGGVPTLAQAAAEETAEHGGAGPGVLTGPEGGFSAEEFARLEAMDCVRMVSLGRNTLRAETAALAACAVLACR
jgi:16S rRNA (uracil1498-N3)-methyltransferase